MTEEAQHALNFINQNLSNLSGSRQAHLETMDAVAVLQKLIDSQNAKVDKVKPIEPPAPPIV